MNTGGFFVLICGLGIDENLVQKDNATLTKISTEDNGGDLFTKALGRATHEHLTNKLDKQYLLRNNITIRFVDLLQGNTINCHDPYR